MNTAYLDVVQMTCLNIIKTRTDKIFNLSTDGYL
jgi:hypothetical protein